MVVLPALLTLYFVFTYISSLRLFVKRAVLAVIAFWCTSADVISNGAVITSLFLTVYSVTLLISTPVKASDWLMFLTGLFACVFFLSMSEFKDGYALSHVAVSVAIAIYSFAAFTPSSRQSMAVIMLCACLLLTSSSGIPLRAYELLTAFFVVFALTENYQNPQRFYLFSKENVLPLLSQSAL